MTTASHQQHLHAHGAAEARRQRRARWATGAGLAVAAAATIAVLAGAQGSGGRAASPSAVPTTSAGGAVVGVSPAGIARPAIEPAPLPAGSH